MILIFGGTTEGRIAIEVCEQAGQPFYYSTKGNGQTVELHHGIRLFGMMTLSEMQAFCRNHQVQCIVDAAHPFAVNLHHTIEQVGLPVIRLQRTLSKRIEGVEYCHDWSEALLRLQKIAPQRLLALTGVNSLERLKPYWKNHETFFRILPRTESLQKAKENEFPANRLLFYPEENTLPSETDERQLMEQLGCDAMITKETGANGGLNAKVHAAISLGLKVFIVEPPPLPSSWTFVTGKLSLRRAIEQQVPKFFALHTGLTTGACATAAAKAAVMTLLDDEAPAEVVFSLPDGEQIKMPIASTSRQSEYRAEATVVKEWNDDPDVTRGCRIKVQIELLNTNNGKIRFLQGTGVGKVTLPGLGIPVGGPAINATPRQMITDEIHALTSADVDVTIYVENGEKLALQTFNPRVGVIGGISIIGTSGIVSPLSNDAWIRSIRRELEVAKAIGCKSICLASGKRSEDSILREMNIRCIHYGNFVGETLKEAYQLGFEHVVLAIMIGKAVKLAEGNLDTHSHKVQVNKEFLKSVAGSEAAKIAEITLARQLWGCMSPAFFDKISNLCYEQCRTVFPQGELTIRLICDEKK